MYRENICEVTAINYFGNLACSINIVENSRMNGVQY